MDYQSEEGVITFAQIWRVVKKSFARAVIYVLVCAVLCFAVLFTVRTVATDNTYSAKITFKQSDETIKTTLDGYRATATSNAVTEVFGTADNATEIYEEVLETLTITSYIPDEYSSDSSYVATIFTVSFEDVDIKGVSKNQQVSLLDNICTELISYYSEVNSVDPLSGTLVWGYTADYNLEYLDILNELETRLSTLNTTMEANIEANVEINSKFATYKSSSTDSNRRTAYEILAQIDNLEYTVSSMIESVCNNGITNTNAAINGSNYCSAKEISLGYKLTELQAISDVYTQQLENLGNVIGGSVSTETSSLSSLSISSSNVYSIDIETYIELVEKLVEVETEMASVQTQISEVQTMGNNLKDNTVEANVTLNAAYMTAAESTINTVIESVYSIIEEYNELVTEFEDSVMPSAYATISKPAATYNDSIISWSLLIIVVLAVAVVAYVVAFGQTWSALKKAGTLDGDKPAAASSPKLDNA